MKAVRLFVLLTLAFTVASSASGQSISGQSPIVRDHVVFWPLAFQFDGSSPTVDVGNRSNLNPSTFTVSAFVKFDALTHPPGSNGDRPAGDMSIVDKIANTGLDNADGWRLVKQDDGFFWLCFGGGLVNGCGEGEATTVISKTAPVVGVWYNVVGVLSRSEIAIYVNGVKEASKPLPSFTDSHSADMRIGSSAQGGGYAYFNGVIDQVTFFPKALNGGAIEILCSATNGDIPCHGGKH